MKRALSGLLITLLSVPISSLAALPAPKAGSPCAKSGITQTYKGFKYTCIKSGKKLVWDKGVKVVLPSPTSKSTPSISTSATPTPIPSPSKTPNPSASPSISTNPIESPSPIASPTNQVFVAPITPNSFENLSKYSSGLAYGAWRTGRDRIEEKQGKVGDLRVLVGPNTKPTNGDPLIAIKSTVSLYSKLKQPHQIYLIEFAKQDVLWAQSEYEKIQDNKLAYNYLTAASDQCPDFTCNNAMAQSNSSNEAILMFGEYDGLSEQEKTLFYPNRFNGGLEAHEYTHAIQITQARDGKYSLLPQWLLEGMATWSSWVVPGSSYADYLRLRRHDTDNLFKNPNLYNADWLYIFLNPNPISKQEQDNWLQWKSYDRWLVYDIGALVTEILVTLRGPDTAMKLYEDVNGGVNFQDAFKAEYGIDWSEACKLMAEVIAKELLEDYPTT